MAFVVDFQGFKSLDNKFIVKELAIVSVDGGNGFLYYLFKPPQPFCSLPDEMKKRVTYLTNYVHGLEWDIGDVDFDSCITFIIDNLKLSAKIIFVKGSERVNYIRNLLNNYVEVVDLDNFTYNTILYGESECSNHRSHCGRCALHKAFAYKYWLLFHGF